MVSIDQHDPPAQAGPTTTTSLCQADGEDMAIRTYFSQDLSSNQLAAVIDSQLAPPKTVATTKESLKVTGRFIQTLMTKLPEIVDGNPVKMALSLAKVVIEIKKVRRCSLYCTPNDHYPRVWKAIWTRSNEG